MPQIILGRSRHFLSLLSEGKVLLMRTLAIQSGQRWQRALPALESSVPIMKH